VRRQNGSDSTQAANDRHCVNDAQGRILYIDQGGEVAHQMIVGGEVLGRYGQGIDPVSPRETSGAPRFSAQAEFSFGYQPINGNYPAPSAGLYTVGAGDTLQGIARGAYGDAQLWYRIAEANGLTGNNDLTLGLTLVIPSNVTNSANTSQTWQPYDAARVVGDTTPNLPLAQGNDCGPMGQLLIVKAAMGNALSQGVAVATAVSAPKFSIVRRVLPSMARTSRESVRYASPRSRQASTA
jgi:hypothetical protein